MPECMREMAPNACAEFLQQAFSIERRFDSQVTKKFKKSAHLWLTDRAIQAVRRNYEAHCQTDEKESACDCSRILLEEFNQHTARSRDSLAEAGHGSKRWWTRAREFMQVKCKMSSIPALKMAQSWTMDATAKADMFVDTFASKNQMIEREVNLYTEIDAEHEADTDSELPGVETVEKILCNLDESSATGPDLVPTRILRR